MTVRTYASPDAFKQALETASACSRDRPEREVETRNDGEYPESKHLAQASGTGSGWAQQVHNRRGSLPQVCRTARLPISGDLHVRGPNELRFELRFAALEEHLNHFQ